MSEIYLFKIHKADARIDNGNVTARLYYPREPEILEKILPENPSFGVKVFERLLKDGYSRIADKDNPIKPASAGSLYVLNDEKIICHRRDKFSPGHKLYHSAYAGYTQSKEHVFSAEGLEETALRESAEECLLITKDKKPWLIVPNDSKEYAIESAGRLGLNLKQRYVDVEVMEPTDILEVYDEDENLIFTAKAFIEFVYEAVTSLNAMQIRRFPLTSEEVVPIDAEGVMKGDKFIHFNRESYVIDPSEIENKSFGSILENPAVYQTKIKNGIPKVFTPQYEGPYLGPDAVEVTHPHIWAPEDLLTRTLDAIGIGCYKGKWMEIELWKEISKLDSKSLLPDKVLKTKII